MSGRPQESSRTGPTYALAEFLNYNWDRMVGRTNEDVAAELGYRSANIISMWRTGRTRIPLEKVPDVARLMRLDLSRLLPLWFEQSWGGRADHKALQQKIDNHVATEAEVRLLAALRAKRPHPSVEFTGPEIEAIVAVAAHEGARDAALLAVATHT